MELSLELSVEVGSVEYRCFGHNGSLLSSGRALLGFLNSWLYEDGRTGLNDITSGYNPGCNTDGFSAIIGWDD